MQSQKILILESFNSYKEIINEINENNFIYDILIIKNFTICTDDDKTHIKYNFQLPYSLKKIIILEFTLLDDSYINNNCINSEKILNDYFKIPFGCEIVNLKYKKNGSVYKYEASYKEKPNYDNYNVNEHKCYGKTGYDYYKKYFYNLKPLLEKNIKYSSYIIDFQKAITLFGNNEYIYTLKKAKRFFKNENKKYLKIKVPSFF